MIPFLILVVVATSVTAVQLGPLIAAGVPAMILLGALVEGKLGSS